MISYGFDNNIVVNTYVFSNFRNLSQSVFPGPWKETTGLEKEVSVYTICNLDLTELQLIQFFCHHRIFQANCTEMTVASSC